MPAIVQRPAPPFKGTAVVNGTFKTIALEEFLGKWVVLFFYPMDFTFVCPTEILAFNDALARFAEINTEVVAASTDSEYSHLAWATLPKSEGGLGPNLKLTLLEDKNHKISKDYGVLIEDEGITLRGLFIIDPKGVLRQITINDLPVGRSVEETIRLIEAFQYHEKHGEGCPANWTQGANTIKLDPKGKLEWFEKNTVKPTNGVKRGHQEDVEMNGHATNGVAKKTKSTA